MKTHVGIVILSFLAVLPKIANAGDGAPAATSSDYQRSNVKLKFKFEGGEVKVPRYQLETKLGVVTGTSLSSPGGTAQVSFSKPMVVNGHSDEDGSYGFLFIPSVDARIDTASLDMKSVKRIEIESGGVALYSAQAMGRHDSPAGQAAEAAKAEKLRQQYEPAYREAQQKAEALFAEYQKLVSEDKVTEASAKLKEVEEAETRASHIFYEARNVLLKNHVKVTRCEFVSREYCKWGSGTLTTPITPDDVSGTNDVVGATADFTLLHLSHIYKHDQDTGIVMNGAQIAPLELSFHAAVKVNGVNVDMCSSLVPVTFVIGKSEGTDYQRIRGSLCVGVGLGKVGHVRHEAVFEKGYAHEKGFKVVNTTSLEGIGGTGLTVGHSHEVQESNEGVRVQKNTFTAGFAF